MQIACQDAALERVTDYKGTMEFERSLWLAEDIFVSLMRHISIIDINQEKKLMYINTFHDLRQCITCLSVAP